LQNDCAQDVRLLKAFAPGHIHGILAAPPCTHFARSGCQWWEAKGDVALLDGLSTIDAVFRIVATCKPVWWCLENPAGRLKDYIGPAIYKFQPYQFGDPYQKLTFLWGHFAPPVGMLAPVGEVENTLGSIMQTKLSGMNNRSATPMGFARAFFESNP
jgi:hypothetical protein